MLPRTHPAVICERVEDGAVLLHREEEVYFGLNVVALRIWELLPPVTRDLDELCGRLAQEYPAVDPAELRGDVVELLTELAAHGLVLSGGVDVEVRDGLAVSAR